MFLLARIARRLLFTFTEEVFVVATDAIWAAILAPQLNLTAHTTTNHTFRQHVGRHQTCKRLLSSLH